MMCLKNIVRSNLAFKGPCPIWFLFLLLLSVIKFPSPTVAEREYARLAFFPLHSCYCFLPRSMYTQYAHSAAFGLRRLEATAIKAARKCSPETIFCALSGCSHRPLSRVSRITQVSQTTNKTSLSLYKCSNIYFVL